MDVNPTPLKWLHLTFPGGSEAILEYQDTHRQVLNVGLDNVSRTSYGEEGFLFASKGWWMDDSRFAMHLDQPSLRKNYYAELAFDGDNITVTMNEQACGEETVVVTGHKQT